MASNNRPAQLRTLNIHIDDATALATWTPEDRAQVLDALSSWEATGIPLRFAIVGPNAKADITVHWVRQFAAPYSGWTTLRGRNGWIATATVLLALADARGHPIDGATRRAVILHEFGHALGLAHARDSTALMWPVAHAGTTLTGTDITAVRRLYGLIPIERPIDAFAQAGR